MVLGQDSVILIVPLLGAVPEFCGFWFVSAGTRHSPLAPLPPVSSVLGTVKKCHQSSCTCVLPTHPKNIWLNSLFFSIGRDLKDNLVPCCCHGQRHFHWTKLPQTPSSLEHFQEWGSQSAQNEGSVLLKTWIKLNPPTGPNIIQAGMCLEISTWKRFAPIGAGPPVPAVAVLSCNYLN